MCSSTRGPAIEPSFVTWPTRKTGTSVVFAKAISRPATSRTCDTLPGALPSSGRNSVWIESMASAQGFSLVASSSTRVASVSARTSRCSESTPSRSARSLVCRRDSSPET